MNTTIAALVAAGLIAGACASDDDSDSDVGLESADAEAEFDSRDDATQAIDDSGRAGAPIDGESDVADPAATVPAAEPVDGGLFDEPDSAWGRRPASRR